MRNIMYDRKAIYYAFERRINGHPLSPAAAAAAAAAASSSTAVQAAPVAGSMRMTAAQAIEDLEVLAR
jgi:hypothetical protein